MILEALPSDLETQHGSFYHGVPSRVVREISIVPKIKSNAVVAYVRRDIDKLMSDKTQVVLWMGSLDDSTKLSTNVPVICTRLLQLPSGKEYTGVSVESYSQSWGVSELLQRDGSSYLIPGGIERGLGYRFSIDDSFQLDSIISDLDLRRKLLGHLGMPRRLRISPTGYIAINPTK